MALRPVVTSETQDFDYPGRPTQHGQPKLVCEFDLRLATPFVGVDAAGSVSIWNAGTPEAQGAPTITPLGSLRADH